MVCEPSVEKCKLKSALMGSSLVLKEGTRGYQQVEARKKTQIPVSKLRNNLIQNESVLEKLREQIDPDGKGKNEYWRLFEKEYVVLRLGEIVESLKKAETNLLRSINNPRKNTPLQERKDELRAIQYELNQILQSKDHSRINSIVAGLHQDYVLMMKKAVRAGYDIDPKIRRQYKIEFQKVEKDMKKFKKAENTARSNISAGIDKLALKDFGYKMKMQNGARVKKTERNEVKFAVMEVLDAMNENAETLKEIFRLRNLTIVHTNGKRPFLAPISTSIHLPKNTLIAVGWRSEFSPDTRIPQAAQKIGDFIDTIPVEKSDGQWYPKFLSESQSSSEFITLATELVNSPSDSMLRMPLKFKSKHLVNKTEEEIINMKKQRESFLRISGRKWAKPRQIWERAFEQYVANQSYKKGRKETFATDAEGYENKAGYWSKESWEKLEPLFEKELQKRFDEHRKYIQQIKNKTTPIQS